MAFGLSAWFCHCKCLNLANQLIKLSLKNTTSNQCRVFSYTVYRVCLSIWSDSDFCSRCGKVHKITDGDWRIVRITSVDSQYVVAFTHCHGTVARYVLPIARLRANVYLHHRKWRNQSTIKISGHFSRNVPPQKRVTVSLNFCIVLIICTTYFCLMHFVYYFALYCSIVLVLHFIHSSCLLLFS